MAAPSTDPGQLHPQHSAAPCRPKQDLSIPSQHSNSCRSLRLQTHCLALRPMSAVGTRTCRACLDLAVCPRGGSQLPVLPLPLQAVPAAPAPLCSAFHTPQCLWSPSAHACPRPTSQPPGAFSAQHKAFTPHLLCTRESIAMVIHCRAQGNVRGTQQPLRAPSLYPDTAAAWCRTTEKAEQSRTAKAAHTGALLITFPLVVILE